MAQPVAAIPHGSMGALFIAFSVSAVFYGVTTIQTVHYFRRFRQDMFIVRVGVAVVWSMETVNTLLGMHSLSHYLVVHRSQPTVLTDRFPWSLPLQSCFNSTLSSVIHMLFAWRIWILSGQNRVLIGFIMLLSFSAWCLGSFVSLIGLVDVVSPSTGQAIVLWSFGLTAGADILVAACLCFFLHIRKTGNTTTNGLLNRVIVLTFHNGLLSSTIALTGLITGLAAPTTAISYGTCFVLGKAYFNTLLSSLNSRTTLRRMKTGKHPEIGITTSTVRQQIDRLGFGQNGEGGEPRKSSVGQDVFPAEEQEMDTLPKRDSSVVIV